MRNKLVLHQIVIIGVLILLSLWKLAVGRMAVTVDLFWWWLGGLIGFLAVFGDRLVYILFMKDEPLSVKFGEMFSRGRYLQSFESLLSERYEQKELVMRSVLFVLAWAILALFASTSVNNFFTRGFVLGIGTHLIFDLVSDYYWNRRRFDMWFWQIKRELPENEKAVFVWAAMVVYAILGFTL